MEKRSLFFSLMLPTSTRDWILFFLPFNAKACILAMTEAASHCFVTFCLFITIGRTTLIYSSCIFSSVQYINEMVDVQRCVTEAQRDF